MTIVYNGNKIKNTGEFDGGHFWGVMFWGCCPGFRGSASLLLALGRVNRLPVALLLVFRAAW